MNPRTRFPIPLAAAAAASVMTALIATPAIGQSIADRIMRTSGDVRFSFKARPSVCGDGGPTIYVENRNGERRVHFRTSTSSSTINTRYSEEWTAPCENGPVRVALTIRNDTVRSVRTYVGGHWRSDGDAVNLGQLSAREAASALITIAERVNRRPGDLLFAATLADSADVTRELFRIARNNDLNRETRRAALFWVSQSASDAAVAGLREIIESDDDVEVRKQAVFAISQLPKNESVPALIDIVRQRGDARIVKQAIFWLGQTDDPRVVAFLEELLLARK